MSISKMSRSANQPVAVGSIDWTSSRRQKKNPRPAEPSRYLSTPATRKSQSRARTSTGSEPRDRLDVLAAAVAEAHVRDRDERRLLVDRLLEALERDRPVRLGGNVLDAHAAPLLRVPDLADRGELEVADDDLVALAVEAQAARERAYAGRDRRRHRDLVLVRVD